MFPDKHFVRISHTHMRATSPAHLMLLVSVTLTVFHKKQTLQTVKLIL